MTARRAAVVIEADGGSRGNPGPAAYGAVLKDAATGEVLAEDGTRIGSATNNVAEYSGLVAGLRLAAELAPEASVEVRMDSRLVVEQMAGRWRIKHPDMKPLAAEAGRLAPRGTGYTWVPRERNGHADRLVNEALDGLRDGVTYPEPEAPAPEPVAGSGTGERIPTPEPARGWGGRATAPTTVILLRHGVTAATAAKRFSGGLSGANPGLTDEGRAQIRGAADWLLPAADRIDAVIASPVRRTRESAAIVAETFGADVVVEPGVAETDFGHWEGLTYAEVAERYPDELAAWHASFEVAPPGGEAFAAVAERVNRALDRIVADHAGRTVLVVSHVTPIKVVVGRTLGDPLGALYTTELAPASVSVAAFYPDVDGGAPQGSLRLFNGRAPGTSPF